MSTEADPKRVIIVHGTGGAPDENWFSWLQAEVSARGAEVILPQFPGPEVQSPETWNAALQAATRPIGSDCVLVGHSIGAAFIMQLLEDAESPVAGTVLASGFVGQLGNDFDGPNAAFFADPFDWQRIRATAGKVTLFFGDNDPYVPRESAERLAEGLDTELTLVPNGGHLNTAAGYTTFPALLDAVADLI